ncbi:ran GTPase-activating protein 1-like [Tropilaelaps mercedesae]|uniref:Ran GTPase-activating protein 1-like n=1 Tax=Tropilaelaps mercedesae TaxID=418985 RepID=A0A1V9Y2P2_9ACAR|nr:ran GTPase-activating protein 1-like [Tropilaelaps mercedesae]
MAESAGIDCLADRLNRQTLEEGVIVSFKGEGKKLDKAEDIRSICDALENTPNVTIFCLQGNTLGSEAAGSLSRSLEKCGKLERLLCEDIFTGRMKSDIPVSLKLLSHGLMTSGCRLVELDFSGNAFGELAINALYTLLTSSTCFSLKELRLNNTGLGPMGGVRLAQALLECLEKSAGKFRLEVFACGRSRLENDGAKALAKFFAQSPNLEEVVIPQDGIFKEGIVAIGEALVNCPNLKILNINDNILSILGAECFKDSLSRLTSLEVLNVGDCVIRSEGAVHIAEAIGNLTQLRELHLDHNEIELAAGLMVVEAVANKSKLRVLELDGNRFGLDGISQIEQRMEDLGLLDALCAFSEDEEDGYNEEDAFTLDDFARNPTPESLLRLDQPLEQAKEYLEQFQCLDLASLMRMFVKFGSASDGSPQTVNAATEICTPVFNQMFQLTYVMPELINLFAVHLGFVKDENKAVKPPRDVVGLLLVTAKFKNRFPEELARALRTFVDNMEPRYCSKSMLPKIREAYADF